MTTRIKRVVKLIAVGVYMYVPYIYEVSWESAN